MITLLKTKWPLFLLLVLAIAGCNKEDDGGDGNDGLVASFTFVVNQTNTLEVAFTNISSGATSYSWDFGDGGSSTEESPIYTYSTGGTFTVVLTASDGTDSKAFDKVVTVADPNSTETFLAGTGSKKWYLLREGIALGVGSSPANNQYWSFGGVAPLGDRPCVLDDSWTFKSDGTIAFESNGTIFIDTEQFGGWLGDMEGCFDDTDPTNMTSLLGEDLSAYASGGDYTYDHDVIGGTLTVNGEGFFIGLPVKTADGDSYQILSTKTYRVIKTAEGNVADTLQVALWNGGMTDASWNFYLVNYHDPSDLPAIPGASAPTAAFTFLKNGFDVSFSNISSSATSYSWDFGDGGSSTDASPTHTYPGFGDYEVTLTAIGSGGMDTETQTVSISNITFSAAVLSNAGGKIWKLDGEASYIVGDAPGSSANGWGGLDANGVIARACQMDDEFIFTNGGTMEYDSKGQVWSESYMGGNNSCVADNDLPSPFDVFGSGTHSFTATPTTITVSGNGAFFGFNKAYNGVELPPDGSGTPASQITYTVLDYTSVGNTEKLTVYVEFLTLPPNPVTKYWTMRMISVN